MTYLYVCQMRLIHKCDMCDVFICGAWLIHMSSLIHMFHVIDSYVHTWHVTHAYVTHLYVCQMRLIYVWHMWLIHMFHVTGAYLHMSYVTQSYVTDSYVCHGSFTCVPWLIHTCDITHGRVSVLTFKGLICCLWWKKFHIKDGWRIWTYKGMGISDT